MLSVAVQLIVLRSTEHFKIPGENLWDACEVKSVYVHSLTLVIHSVAFIIALVNPDHLSAVYALLKLL